MYMYSCKYVPGNVHVIQMENSLLAIFDKSPCTIVQGLWPDFGANYRKSNFDRNQLKLSTQHKYMYMYQKW